MTQPQTTAQLADSLGAVSAGLRQMQAGVASGTLVIEPAAGQKLSAASATAQYQSNTLRARITQVSQQAQLGSNAMSTAMTGKFLERADGADSSLGPLLAQYQELLNQAKAAVDTCIANFGSTDTSLSGDLAGK